MLAAVSSLIKQNGKRCKVTHVDGSTSTAFGVVTRPSKGLADGMSVAEDSLVCWLQGTIKRVPDSGDIVKIGTNSYYIVSVNRVQPDGTLTYAYAAEVRI